MLNITLELQALILVCNLVLYILKGYDFVFNTTFSAHELTKTEPFIRFYITIILVLFIVANTTAYKSKETMFLIMGSCSS